MAKKAKKAVKAVAVKKASRTSAQQYKAMAAAIKKGKLPETVGEHFRARIVEGKLSNEEILKEVRQKQKSKATMSSLYWNRQYLSNHDNVKLD